MTDIKISSTDHSSRLATASKDVVVGFDDDLLEIKKQLFGESRKLQIIPIVGMGGIGKTTLASNAYHDSSIQALFDIGGWVTVSQSYNDEEIISTLLRSLKPFKAIRVEESHESPAKVLEQSSDSTGTQVFETIQVEECDESPAKLFEQSSDSTGTKVFKTLKRRKFLIVMDDIWNTGVCDDLNRIFPDDENGSRVILTTRRQDVAIYGNNCSPHNMQLLDEDQSWDLLRQKVFDGVCDGELEDIGMAIARSCGGLPLAIVIIAGLLSTVDRTRASWEEIAEKVNSTVAAKNGQFEKILSLSYTDLPRHLKQCFAYMGGFPEDCEIPVAKLYKLWIAQGFVEAIIASRSLEELAEECLQDLINRNLVFVGTRKPYGEIKSCSLHDLMRDLCKKKGDEDKFPLYDINVHETLAESTFEDVKDLRVLDWDPAGQGIDASQIYFWLSGLRYLVLDCFVELPAGISNLENLQTLIIKANKGLVRLTPEIWRMQQLRHLVSSFDQLPCPRGATSFPLGNLQTLSRVSNLECTYRFVKMIPNIKKLGIIYTLSYEFEQAHHMGDFLCLHPSPPTRDYDFHLENLQHLHQLEQLKVQVYRGFQGMFNPVFPWSLKKLSLSGWVLPSWKDMTIVGSLPNLQVLKLKDFWGQDDEWETAEDEFASLSFLLIERSDLQEWKTESGHFPKLKQLLLHYCFFLHTIPADVGEFPSLELIEVREGNEYLEKSAKRIEEEQKDMGNDSLRVVCI